MRNIEYPASFAHCIGRYGPWVAVEHSEHRRRDYIVIVCGADQLDDDDPQCHLRHGQRHAIHAQRQYGTWQFEQVVHGDLPGLCQAHHFQLYRYPGERGRTCILGCICPGQEQSRACRDCCRIKVAISPATLSGTLYRQQFISDHRLSDPDRDGHIYGYRDGQSGRTAPVHREHHRLSIRPSLRVHRGFGGATGAGAANNSGITPESKPHGPIRVSTVKTPVLAVLQGTGRRDGSIAGATSLTIRTAVTIGGGNLNAQNQHSCVHVVRLLHVGICGGQHSAFSLAYALFVHAVEMLWESKVLPMNRTH